MGRTVAPSKLQQLGDLRSGTTQSMAGGFTSPVIDTLMMDFVSWEGVYTGTPAGTFTIETSNQYDGVLNPTATFITMPPPTPAFPVPAGAGGSFLVTTPGLGIGQGSGRWQRLRWVPSSGAGNLSLWVTGTAGNSSTITQTFTPAALGSTLKLWLRGDLGVTQSGGIVSAWADQSGNGNGCAEAVNKPSLITGLNGLPALSFTTALSLASATPVVPAGNPRTIFLVMRNGVGTTGGPFFFKTAAPIFEVMWINTGTGRTYIYTDAVSSGKSIPLIANYDISCIIEVGWDGNTAHQVTCAINGASQTVNEELGAMNSDTGTGGYRVGGTYDGEISEVIVCDTVLSAPNELLVKTYLSTRYGIAVV